MRKYDQLANQHVCHYLRREAKRLGQTVSREAGAAASAAYGNEVCLQQYVLPIGSPEPYGLRQLLGMCI